MRAIVTGVSAGIGGEICQEIARRDPDQKTSIGLCVRRKSDFLDELVADLQAKGVEVAVLMGDLSDPEAPARMVQEAIWAFGGLNAVIANAAMAEPGPLVDLTLESFNKLMLVNCYSVLALAQAAYPHLKESVGSFVAISSLSGNIPCAGTAAYGMSKAALSIMCRMLALEWADDGIRVNTISPGLIRTPLNAPNFDRPGMLEHREGVIPLHSIGKPLDIARAAWFLASRENTYATGTDLIIDGGLTASTLNQIRPHGRGHPS